MSQRLTTHLRPQEALQSYLDDLLQEATEVAEAIPEPCPERPESAKSVPPKTIKTASSIASASLPTSTITASVESVSQPIIASEPPVWGKAPFECLLFDVAGLKLAVPLLCLGSIYSLKGKALTPLFGQPDWFLGILPLPSATNLKVVDTARWLLDDRYLDEYRQGLHYLISIQGYQWGLAVHQVSHSIRLEPRQVKWRSERNKRPWLAGTVIEHMCALLDVEALVALIHEKEQAPRATFILH